MVVFAPHVKQASLVGTLACLSLFAIVEGPVDRGGQRGAVAVQVVECTSP
jgi:hypothetical protein